MLGLSLSPFSLAFSSFTLADGSKVPYHARQRVRTSGSLEISSVDKIDAGKYSCVALFGRQDQAKIAEHSMLLAVKGTVRAQRTSHTHMRP